MLDIRPMTLDDWAPLSEVLAESFNIPAAGWTLFRDRIGLGNFRVATLDGRVVGGYGVYRIGQHWLGRSVPLGGVAGVGVAPHARGRGVAQAMMVDALGWLRAEGVPVAGLYPASLHVYRSVGYEQAGERVRYEVPLAALAGFRFEVDVTPVDPTTPTDPGVLQAFQARYRPAHGHLTRDEALWARLCQPYTGRRFAWLIGDDGYVILHHHPAEGPPFDLEVVDLAAPSPATARTLMALFGGHRSLGRKVRWYAGPADPLLTLVPEPVWSVVEHQRWMLRIVDARAALVARGWPVDAAGELHLQIEDDLLSGHAGPLVLSVAGGRAEVHAGGRGALRVHPRGLGPLYSGYFSATTLAGLGLLEGPPEALVLADRLFAAPTPWMREMY